MITVEASGPLFAGRLRVREGARVGAERIAAEGARFVRAELGQRTRYRTPRYGHVMDAVRSTVRTRGGDGLEARIFLGGLSAFLGPILESGARPHPIPRLRIRGAGARRTLVRRRTPLAFRWRGAIVFRQQVNHPGVPGYRWRQRAEAALEPRVQPLLEQAMAEALDGR